MVRFALTLLWFIMALFYAAFLYPFYVLSGRKIGKNIGRNIFTMGLWLNKVKLDVEGRENIDPGEKYLVVSNHQSVFDIPIVCSALTVEVRIFAKKELAKVPLFGQLLYLYDFVFVDRKNKREAVRNLKKASEIMKRYSFLVFPEGTRSVDGKVQPFKTGAVSLAQDSNVMILPVAILDSRKIMEKGRLKINPGTVKVKIFEPVKVSPGEKRKEIAEKLHAVISQYIEKNLET